MLKTKLSLVIALLLFSSCRTNKRVEVKFSGSINRYNYLDKPHKLIFVYDFQDAISNVNSKKLVDRLKRIKENDNVTFIVIFNQYKGDISFKESAIKINHIFKNKYDLDKVINFNIDITSKRMNIGYSKNLSEKINDSICNVIMEKELKPKFKESKFYIGIDKSVNSFMNYIK